MSRRSVSYGMQSHIHQRVWLSVTFLTVLLLSVEHTFVLLLPNVVFALNDRFSVFLSGRYVTISLWLLYTQLCLSSRKFLQAKEIVKRMSLVRSFRWPIQILKYLFSYIHIMNIILHFEVLESYNVLFNTTQRFF